MSDEEIYLTCLCGALVNEANMIPHVENCLKEDFIKKSISLKISTSSGNSEEQPKEREVLAACVRCGHAIVKGQGSLITFYPHISNNYVACCCYRSKSAYRREGSSSICEMCKLPSDFHNENEQESGQKAISCVNNIKSDQNAINCDNREEKEKKCREHQPLMSEFLENNPENEDDSEANVISEHEHTVIHNGIPNGPRCKLFHAAILPNYNKGFHEDLDCGRNYSLLIQILDTLKPFTTPSTQTDLLTSTKDKDIQVKILGVYPAEIEELLSK